MIHQYWLIKPYLELLLYPIINIMLNSKLKQTKLLVYDCQMKCLNIAHAYFDCKQYLYPGS